MDKSLLINDEYYSFFNIVGAGQGGRMNRKIL
jgi:hypothetical protein